MMGGKLKSYWQHMHHVCDSRADKHSTSGFHMATSRQHETTTKRSETNTLNFVPHAGREKCLWASG